MSKPRSSRVGKVQAYLRGRVWYLCYFENCRRHRSRVGPAREAARQLAAQVNEILAAENPTRGNLELSLHIDSIRCFRGGRVVMRTCKLGALDGVAKLVANRDASAER
jgi:hypothetical protein